MPRTIEKTVFKFDELSDQAKESARNWWRDCENADSDSLLDRDDFEAVAKILGIEFDTKSVKLMNGSSRQESTIYYSGFSSQGDGACFEGRYSYAKNAFASIKAYAPQDAMLHSITANLQDIQRKHFYSLEARMKHSGQYYHSGCMSVDVSKDGEFAPRGAEDAITDAMRSFADWIYSQL